MYRERLVSIAGQRGYYGRIYGQRVSVFSRGWPVNMTRLVSSGKNRLRRGEADGPDDTTI